MSNVIPPYAITQEELHKVASEAYVNKKIKMSTAYSDTKMKTAIVNNEIILIF
jgi:hypothetical protein